MSNKLLRPKESVDRGFLYYLFPTYFLFQTAIQPLRDGTDLRDNVQTALADFKETCGLSPIANIKQCIRLLSTRISSSSEQGSLNLYMNGEVSSELSLLWKSRNISFNHPCVCRIELSNLSYLTVVCKRGSVE